MLVDLARSRYSNNVISFVFLSSPTTGLCFCLCGLYSYPSFAYMAAVRLAERSFKLPSSAFPGKKEHFPTQISGFGDSNWADLDDMSKARNGLIGLICLLAPLDPKRQADFG